MIIDYSIHTKDLLIEVIYHTCSLQSSEMEMKRSQRDLLRSARIAREALKVVCIEEELIFHIMVAQGDSSSLEKTYGVHLHTLQHVEDTSQQQSHANLPTNTAARYCLHCKIVAFKIAEAIFLQRPKTYGLR